MDFGKTREDWLNQQQPKPVIVLNWDQVVSICQVAIAKYEASKDHYRDKFASLPDELEVRQVAEFLKTTKPTIYTKIKEGILNFVDIPGKRLYITREQLIEDCRKHGLV